MQIYVKSAGFSINQDYTWVDNTGHKADIDLSVLSYNVDGVKFVWKSTDTAIYIFANGFAAKDRVDLYNRPLRNYVCLEGKTEEAEFMYQCFAKMLLDQKNFENMLNSNIRNTKDDSNIGFFVDFEKIYSFFDSPLPDDKKTCRLRRYLYENDSFEARKDLLNELFGVRRKPLTLFVGGDLSGERLKALSPDRALLNHIDRESLASNKCKPHIPFKSAAIALGAVTLSASILVLMMKRDEK